MLRDLLLFSLAAGGFMIAMVVINLAVLPRISRAARFGSPSRWPPVSVVIPARNEERAVEDTVRAHLNADYPSVEVIVVDDRSTDRTPEILAALAGSDARLRVVAGQDPPAGWLGKPHALHLGSQAASGELLLFADADVRYHPEALREAVISMEQRRLDFLALLPDFEMRGFWENVLMPNIPLTYFFGPAVLANSDRFRWIAAGGGAGNLVRRSVYHAVGGHSSLKGSVIDDVRLALVVKSAGFRCRAFRAEDRISVRMYRGFREVWDGFTKNVAYAFRSLFGALVLLLMIVTMVPALLPAVVLALAVAGVPIGAVEAKLAGAGLLASVVARVPVAVALRHPLWTTLTNPLMVAVWGGIILRSAYWRFIRKEVRWRGRRYDARGASL
jgi:chlorobactene glucosyltransferase